MGKEWLNSSRTVLEKPLKVDAPYKEAFYLDPAKAEAIGYRFSVNRGQKIEVKVTILGNDSMKLFIDLYRVNNDSLKIWQHVASADSIEHILAFEPRRDADYILRLQPELLRGGKFGVSILKVPSYSFPVTGKNSRAIGSYFGDPRDGGKREHHGVDIFAKRHTPIIAPVKGYVRRVGERGLGGNVIWIRDSNGNNLYFAHLQKQLVKQHTYVNPGDTIGTVGNTGNAKTTPPHLHFGIYKNGPIDPVHFIKETNIVLPGISTDLASLGNWARARQKTHLSFTDKIDIPLDTLESYEIMKVIGTIGSMLRVALPNGLIGYVSESDVESVEAPIMSYAVNKSYELLDAPMVNAVVTKELSQVETIAVLALHKDFLFVRTSLGNVGWISTLSNL